MGLDFIQKAAKSFHKGLDRSRIELATPDLFTQNPDRAPRTYAAQIRPNATLALGEELSVQYRSGMIVMLRGMDIVADFCTPPAELIEALRESYGEACGTVREVYDVADTVEISLC